MKLPEMKTGLTISALIHAALLLWGLVSFAGRSLEAKPNDGMPVDIISDKQFSEMTKGTKTGAKDKPPAPLVEKIGDPKPVDDPTPKVTEKKEIKTAKEAEPPPPAPPPEPKPEPKQVKKEPPKPDVIAETLKKEEAKKRAEDQARVQQQQPKPVPHFDPTKIAALLDKRQAMRQASAGDTLNPSPSVGYMNGAAAQLSQSEMDALRERLKQCWNPPVGALDAGRLKVVLNVQFKPDGSVAAPPQIVAGTPSSLGPAMAESAVRAILTCQPFKMLKPEHYQQWKEIEMTFDPREMFGG